MHKIIPLLLLALLTAGCVPVKNSTDAWKKAELDPALEGQWTLHSPEQADPMTIIFTKADDHYAVTTIEKGEAPKQAGDLKSFTTKGQTFALLQEPGKAPEANLWPYDIKNGTLMVAAPPKHVTYEINKLDNAALADLIKTIKTWPVTITGKKAQ